MSNIIDENIIMMEFENAAFENGITQTMTSINKLNDSLAFKKGTDGLDDIGQAIKKTSFSPLITGIESAQRQLSAMSIVGITALQNLTTAAMNAGTQMIKSLTLDPVMSGFNEYETKMNSIKTILANTSANGTDLEDVNNALADLNDYADQTIYNFAQMTDMVGKFSATSGELDSSVNIVKGMANLAAYSGVENTRLQSALFQTSQAMTGSFFQAMDWMSLESAGLATQKFRTDVLDMAEAMGTLSAAQREAIENGTMRFNDSLSDIGWLTTDVFSAVTEIYAMDEAMTKAAGEVTTLTKLFDVLAETVQSSWAVSWEYIIGDKQQSLETLTAIKEGFEKLAAPINDARNAALEFWNQNEGRSSGLKGLQNIFEAILRVTVPIADAFTEIFVPLKGSDLVNITKQFEEFTETLLASPEVMTDVYTIAKGLFTFLKGMTDIFGQVATSALQLVGALGQFATTTILPYLAAISEAFTQSSDSMSPWSEMITKGASILGKLGGVISTVVVGLGKVLAPFEEIPEMFIRTIDGILTVIDDLLTVLNLTDVLEGGFEGIASVITTIVSGPLGLLSTVMDGVANIYQTLSSGFGQFTSGLTEVDSGLTTGEHIVNVFIGALTAVQEFGKGVLTTIQPLIDKVTDLIQPLMPIINNVKSLFGWLGSTAISIVTNLTDSLVDMTEGMSFDNVGDIVTFIQQFLLLGGVLDITKTVKGMVKGVSAVPTAFADLIKSTKKITDNIANVVDGLTGALEAMQLKLKADALFRIATAIAILAGSIVVLSLIDPARLEVATMAIAGLALSLASSLAILSKIEGLKIGSTSAAVIGLIGFASALGIMVGAVAALAAIIAKVGLNTLWSAVSVIAVLGTMMTAFIAGLSKVTESANPATILSTTILLGVMTISISTMVSQVAKLADLNNETAGLWNAIAALTAITTILVGFSTLATKLAESINPGSIIKSAAMLLPLSYAIGLLVTQVSELAVIPVDALKNSLIGMGAIATGLVAFVVAMTAATSKMNPIKMIVGLTALAVVANTLTAVTRSLLVLQGIDPGSLVTSVLAIGTAVAAMTIALLVAQKNRGGAVGLIAMTAALMGFTVVILLLSQLSMEQVGVALLALAGSLLVIAGAAALLTPIIPSILAFGAALLLLGAGILSIALSFSMFAAAIIALVPLGAGLTGILLAIGSAIITMLEPLATSAGKAVVAFIQQITDGIPVILELIRTLWMGILEEIRIITPQLISTVLFVFNQLILGLEVIIPKLINFGLKMLTAFLTGIRDNIYEVTMLVGEIIVKFITALTEQLPNIVDAGVNFIITFLERLADTIRNNSERFSMAVLDVGKAIVDGLVIGITNGWKAVFDAGASLGQAALDGMMDLLDINSPSEETKKQVGWMTAIGQIIGMEEMVPEVESTGGDLGQAAIDGMTETANPTTAYESGYNIGSATAEGITDGIGEITQSYTDAKAQLDEVIKMTGMDTTEQINAYEMLRDTQTSTIADVMDAEEKLNTLRNELYTENEDRITQTIEDTNASIEAQIGMYQELYDAQIEGSEQAAKAEEKLADLRKKATDDYYKHITTVEENIKNLQNDYDTDRADRIAEISGTYGIFEEIPVPEEEERVYGSSIISNLNEQAEALEEYHAKIKELNTLGLSQNLVDQIEAEGISAIDELNAILGMSESQLKQFQEASDRIQATSTEQTDFEMQGQKLEVESAIVAELESISTLFDTEAPKIGLELTTGIISGITMGTSPLVQEAFNAAQQATQAMSEAMGIAYIKSPSIDMSDAYVSNQDSIPVTDFIISDTPEVKEQLGVIGDTAVTEVLDGMVASTAEINTTAKNIMTKIISSLDDYVRDFVKIAENWMYGLRDGIRDNASVAINEAEAVAQAIIDASERALDINSPSGVGMWIGKMWDDGVANGIWANINTIGKASQDVTNEIQGQAFNIVDAIQNLMGVDDFEPVIAPTLDLTNVSTGMSKLSTIFNNMQTGIAMDTQLATKATGVNQPNDSNTPSTSTSNTTNITYNQTNNSPKALSALDIYRNTKNLIKPTKGVST